MDEYRRFVENFGDNVNFMLVDLENSRDQSDIADSGALHRNSIHNYAIFLPKRQSSRNIEMSNDR